jgi:uncharacterized protein YfaS (alpha-2-macroglobulin family)
MRPLLRRALRNIGVLVVMVLVLRLTVYGCSSSSKQVKMPTMVVMSFATLDGARPDQPKIRIRFSRPAVARSEVGKLLEDPPVLLGPALSVQGHWSDRQTLVIQPRSRLKPGTRYEVYLTGKLAHRNKKVRFHFVYAPLELERISGVVFTRLPPRPRLLLHFNYPVRAGDVAKSCFLREPGGLWPKALTTPMAKYVSKVIPVTTVVRLANSRTYKLRCVSLVSANGGVPVEVFLDRKLTTFPGFRIVDVGPIVNDYPPGDVPIEVTFSTPVAAPEIRKHIRISPAVEGMDKGWVQSSGKRYKATVELKGNTRYTVTVDAALKDQFGQPLGRKQTFTFKTGRPRATLQMERGIYALEATSAGYPVWTRSMRHFEVDCAPVPKDKLVKVITSRSYDPWYGGRQKKIRWSKLGLSHRSTDVKLPAKDDTKNDKWKLHHLSLHKMCGASSPRGVFLAQVSSDELKPHPDYSWRFRPYRRVLTNVTDLGVLLKVGPASGLVWVSSLKTGKPVWNAKVTLYTKKGKVVHRGRTNHKGLARIPGAAKLLKHLSGRRDDWVPQRAQRLIAVVEKNQDLAVVDGNWSNGIQLWNFGVKVDHQSTGARIRGFIQSDRGIYRPGETVHFKGLVREIRLGALPRVPRSRKVHITVRDGRGAVVLNTKRRITRYGGFAFDLALSKHSSLGDYYVQATVAKQSFQEKFSVQAFRKISYEIKMRSAKRHVRVGEKVKLKATARYLFGAPVKNAKYRVVIQRRERPVRFGGYPGYVFKDWASSGSYYGYGRSDSGYYGYSFVEDDEGRTDENGGASLAVATTTGGSGAQDYLAQITVTDETDQSVSGSVVITAHATDVYVGLHTQEYVQAVGRPFAVNTVALSPAGKRVATRAKLSFERTDYKCKWRGRYRAYRTCSRKKKVVWTRDIRIPATGAGTVKIQARKPGEYTIRLTAKDSKGKKVVATSSVWIMGRGDAFRSGDESVRMQLITSKKRYQPGETARLVPRTALRSATALITLERNGVMDAWVTRLRSPAEGIKVKLGHKHAPNVYATVTLVSGRTGAGDRHRPRFTIGVVNLQVSPVSRRLKVRIRTHKKQYEPGEMVRGTIRVTSATGAPVRAELSLSVADEGVLQLIGYRTPSPMARFFAPWGIGVENATNWNRIARLKAPRDDIESGGDGGGGGDGPKVRSRFVSSAYWAPNLYTNAAGYVTFRFKAPDNLTSFRLMAVAADVGSRFGKTARRITVTKPLLAKPVLPRFLSTGDRAEVGVVIHNYTDQDGVAKVRVKGTGIKLATTTASVKVPRRGSARVRFEASVGFVRRAQMQFSVRMGRYRDALRLDLPVRRPLAIDKKILAGGRLRGTKRIPVKWLAATLLSDSHLEISADRTGMTDLREGLKYLVKYPYGCLEQTLSRFIPLVKVKDLASSLGFAELKGPRLKRFIRAGVDKVVRHQKHDGHFSLWPSGQTYPHLTAYAMYGLVEAKRAGVHVDPETVKKGQKALRTWANGRSRTIEPGGEAAVLAMTAYVLAELGKPDQGLNARLYAARNSQPSFGLAFLLRALNLSKAPASQLAAVQKDLLSLVQEKQGVATVLERSGNGFSPDGYHKYMSSDVRSSAITLSALLATSPKHPLVGKLAAGLKKRQLPSGRWSNTQENLYALVALADYARLQAKGVATITVSMNGKRIVRRALRNAKILSLKRSLAGLKPGVLTIRLQGAAHYTVRLVTAQKASQAKPVSRGFTVSREYLDPDTNVAFTLFKAGSLVKVRVKVTLKAASRWVAVVDPLPGGLEPVNSKLATSVRTTATGNNAHWTHLELRDDRVQAFADNLPAGTYTLEYLARATLPGTFTAPPTHAEQMYAPDQFGRTATLQVKVTR